MSGSGAANVLMVYLEPTPYILGLICRLREKWGRGADVVFVAENLSQNWGLLQADIPFETLPLSYRSAFRAIWGKLSSNRFRLLHLAGWGHPLLLTALVIARVLRIQVVVESDTPLPYSFLRWKSMVKKLLYPLLFRLPGHFLPGGTRQAAYLRHYGVEESRMTIANMTVDVDAIKKYLSSVTAEKKDSIRASYGIPKDDVVFLYVGRMESYKGVRQLLAVFRQLREDYEHISLLLVGDGGLRDLIIEFANNNTAIHFAGRLSGSCLWNAYSVADVFILPSHFEPWGLVVNEAMAAELPVIASDRVGSVDDLVVSEETGLVFEAESEPALKNAISWMLAHPERRKELGTNGKRLISGWTLDNEAHNVINAWNKLL